MHEQHRKRRLPHWDKPGAIYFVTTCLQGSIPAMGLNSIENYRHTLKQQAAPEGMSPQKWEDHKWKLLFAKADSWLDRSSAVRHLENHEMAIEVEKTILHFAGERYAIWAWVVMPNHFHCVFEAAPQWVKGLGEAANERTPRERIMHSVKRHSARQCNLLLGQTGPFWQEESYDHCVADADELERIINYVEQNPVKAGIVTDANDYRFSSTRYRRKNGILPGRPLIGETQLNALN